MYLLAGLIKKDRNKQTVSHREMRRYFADPHKTLKYYVINGIPGCFFDCVLYGLEFKIRGLGGSI